MPIACPTPLDSARALDSRLKALVAAERQAEAELACALEEMSRTRLYRALGYPRLGDYALQELGVSPSKAKDLVEIVTKSATLPRIREAFESGELPWTKARQILRIAEPETEEHWLEEAERLSNRGLETAVSREKGEPVIMRRVLELTPAQAADFDAILAKLREEVGEAIPAGEAAVELFKRAMGAPVDQPGYQVVIHECPRCETASRDAVDGPVEVAGAELAVAKDDAETLNLREGGTGVAKKAITTAERKAVIARDHGCCGLCKRRAWLHIHHVQPEGGVEALRLLCSVCHKRLVHAGHVSIDGRKYLLRDGSVLSSSPS